MPKKDSAKLAHYSVDPYRYLALCRSDHVKYDMAVAELRASEVARDERSHCEAAAERMGHERDPRLLLRPRAGALTAYRFEVATVSTWATMSSR